MTKIGGLGSRHRKPKGSEWREPSQLHSCLKAEILDLSYSIHKMVKDIMILAQHQHQQQSFGHISMGSQSREQNVSRLWGCHWSFPSAQSQTVNSTLLHSESHRAVIMLAVSTPSSHLVPYQLILLMSARVCSLKQLSLTPHLPGCSLLAPR